MEMSISRKALNVAAIIDYISGGLEMILCMIIMGTGAMALTNTEIAESMPAAFGATIVILTGLLMGISAAISLTTAYLSRRAAKDPTKIMPVWYISLVSLVLNAGTVIVDLVNKVPVQDMSGNFLAVAIAIAIFCFANNVRKEANL